jgi:ubiquinone/menaquinone biosynthesis C-methylase UbiE
MNEILPAGIAKADVPKLYSRLAPIYDFWAGLTETKARRRCLDRCQIRDGEAILEVAVGTGLMFREVLRLNRSGRTVGIDVTEPMLARACRKAESTAPGGSWELRIGDAYALDLPDGSFDLVVNNYMFDLLPEQDFSTVLRQFHRVLKPGGRMVLVNMTTGMGPWNWLYRRSPALLGGCRGVELAEHVRAVGFVDVERELLMQLGFPSEILVAKKQKG